MGVIRGLTIILEDTHWYFFIAGVVFLGIGFALYEAEENYIQNWLKNSHKKLDEIAKKVTGKHSSAISIFAAKVSYFLDRIFGTSILGMRNFLATCNLSVLSFYVFEFVLFLMMVHSAHGNYRDFFLTNWSMEAWFYSFIALLLFPLSISFNKYRGYWGWLVFIGTILHLANILTIQPRGDNGVGSQIIDSWLHKPSWFASSDDFFFLSSCELFYFIAILALMQTTRLLRITVKLGIEKNLKFVEWCLMLLYFCVLFLTLVVFIVTFKTEKLNDVYVSYVEIHNNFTLAFMIYGIFCLLQILLVVFFALCVLTLMANHVIWNVIKRPIYAMHRYNLIGNHKLFFKIGCWCLGLFSAKWLPFLNHL